MNKDQVQSLARSLLKAGGAALMSHGLTQSSVTQTIIGAVPTVVGFIWSHFVHADDATQPPTQKGNQHAS